MLVKIIKIVTKELLINNSFFYKLLNIDFKWFKKLIVIVYLLTITNQIFLSNALQVFSPTLSSYKKIYF